MPKTEEDRDDVESDNRLAQDMAEWRRRLAREFPIVDQRLQRETYKVDEDGDDEVPEKIEELCALELQSRMESGGKRKILEPNKASQECKEISEVNNSELKTRPALNSDVWKRRIENGIVTLEERIKRNTLELEKSNTTLDKKEESNGVELEEKNSDSVQSLEIGDENRVAENAVPLMTEETVSIDLSEYENSSPPTHRRIMRTHVNKNWDIKKKVRSLSVTSAVSQIKVARKNSKSAVDYFCKVVTIILTCVGILLIVGILSSVSIAMITIGSLYLNDCPAQPYIPIYLVVGGASSMVLNLILICCKDNSDACIGCVVHLLNLYQTVWFIMGCIWVYGVKNVDYYNTDNHGYCHKTLYLFTYWLLNSVFILLGSTLGLGLCGMCCAAII